MYCRLDLVLIEVSTLNPFSDQELIEKLTSAQIMVTVENHRVSSGLGKIVGQVLHQERASTTLITVGVGDTFAHGGSVPYLEEFYGTSRSHIAQAIRGALGMKSDPRGAVTIGGSVELADGIAEGLQRSVSYPVGGDCLDLGYGPSEGCREPIGLWLFWVLASCPQISRGSSEGQPGGPSLPTMDTLSELANPNCPDCLTRCYFTSHGYRYDDCGSLVGEWKGTASPGRPSYNQIMSTLEERMEDFAPSVIVKRDGVEVEVPMAEFMADAEETEPDETTAMSSPYLGLNIT